MKRDPCCVVLFGLCLMICEVYAADSRMCILRTMFLCIQGQSWHVHSYEGTCGDSSALDILKLHWESIRPLLKTFWTRSRLFSHYRIRNQFLAGGALSHIPAHPWCQNIQKPRHFRTFHYCIFLLGHHLSRILPKLPKIGIWGILEENLLYDARSLKWRFTFSNCNNGRLNLR